jgi:predicted HD phosphohydrolase
MHETEELTPRQELAVERIMADESLTGELTDAPAKALIRWATAKVAAAAGDNALSDEQVSAYGKAVRTAVRAAIAAGHDDPAQLVASAEAALPSPDAGHLAQAAPSTPSAAVAAAKPPAQPRACSAPPSVIGSQAAPVAEAPQRPHSWVERWCRWLQKERDHDHS